jgi:hypothetical protein
MSSTNSGIRRPAAPAFANDSIMILPIGVSNLKVSPCDSTPSAFHISHNGAKQTISDKLFNVISSVLSNDKDPTLLNENPSIKRNLLQIKKNKENTKKISNLAQMLLFLS